MSKWNKVVSGFVAEDETVNFGTRNFAESNGSLYETWTLATIEPNIENKYEPVTKSLNVNATIWHERICVAIGTCITIFQDQTCQNVLASIEFDSPITSYCLSIDGSFLFVSIETAMLHSFVLVNGGRQLFNIDFMKKYNCSRIIDVCLRETQHNIDVIVVTLMGNIYKINGIERSLANDHINDYRQVETYVNLISTNLPMEYAVKINCDTLVSEPDNDSELSMIVVGKKLCILPDRISCYINDLPYKYTKIQFFHNYKAMICLRNDGHLNIICMKTLLGIKIWDGPVQDFSIIDEKLDSSNQILVLMRPKINESSTFLHLISFPDFNIIFTMSVSSSTYLVNIVGSTIDRLIFLEGIKALNDSLNVIRIKAIEEGTPDCRLQRLLRQKRFDDAQIFAQKFNLDIDKVFRAEASMFINGLHTYTDIKTNIDFNKFKTILDNINDVKFIYECCNNNLNFNVKDIRMLCEYAYQRIIQSTENYNTIKEDNIFQLLQNISHTLRKLKTFEIIQMTILNNEANEISDLNDWNKFCKANLLDECIRCLSFGELDTAALIWIRHISNFAQTLTKDTIIKILETIPSNLQPSELWPWLRYFIPSVTTLLPVTLATIIGWGCKKIKMFEIFHSSCWPEIGLEFANGFIDLLHNDEYNICAQFHHEYAYNNSKFHQLTDLMQAMTHLLDLKLHYKISLPLRLYLGDPNDVINLLLAKVHIDALPQLMKNFLRQYILNNSLQNDKVLSNFIQNTLRNSKDWWLWEKAPWDKRLTVIIGFIHNIHNCLQQTLQILKNAPVPWSETITELAEKSYIYDHPLVSQIRNESNCVTEKLILKKYGFAHTRPSMKLFHSIVKQNRASMIDDIFELTKTDLDMRMTILYFCVSYHLQLRNIDNIMNIFKQLSDDVVFQCYKQLVYVTHSKLNFLLRQKQLYKYSIIFEVLSSLEMRLQKSMEYNSKYAECQIFMNTVSDLHSCYQLNNELNTCITINTYIKNKKKVLIDYIKGFIDKNVCDDMDWPNICKKIERINSLLHLPKFYGIYHFLKMSKCSTTLKFYILSYLADNKIIFKEESEYIIKICSLLLREPENNSQMTIYLQNLCSSLICLNDENLIENLRLCKYVDAYSEAVGTRFNANEPTVVLATDNYISKLYPIYRDASISSGCILLPLLQDGFKILLFYRSETEQEDITYSYNDEKTILSLCREFINKVRVIQNEHHDFSLLKIITTIYSELYFLLPQSEKAMLELQFVINHCANIMLHKVINGRIFDLQLGLTCLFLLPDTLKSLTSIVKIFEFDYPRDKLVKDLGYEYCRLTNNINQMEIFKFQRVLHYWGHRLINYGISYREVLQSDTEKQRAILRCVMMSNEPDIVELLHDFCESFCFNRDDCYLSYLQHLLSSWQPKYDSNSIVNNPNELKIDTDDVNKLFTACKKIAAEISDKATMKLQLIQMITQINFYHYEIFILLLELTGEINIEKSCYLCFLQNYTRVGIPTDIEYDEWKKFSEENELLPRIAQWRLPYLPKIDQYKLITPELNFKTYEKWLSIAGILNIPVHNICTLAVKGAVTAAWKNDKDFRNEHEINTTKWSINLRNSALLKDIKKCISYMTGPKGLYYATAALYYVVNHTPPGADLVAVAKECYVYSQRWEQESVILHNTKLSKIKDKYLKYTTKHILHIHGLGQEKYLNLVEHPEKLVRELYQDNTIPYRYKCTISHRPDINAAVNALDSIYPLNLVKIRFELLNEWLQPMDNRNSIANDSITTNFTQDLSSDTAGDTFVVDNNFLRACYIVSSGDAESFANYLIGIGFPEEHDYCNKPGVRFRALRILQSTMDEEILRNYVKRDIKTFNRYMKTLKYLNELENLGLCYSVSGFDMCSKSKLVHLLIDNQNCISRALQLIPQLYIDYNIDDYGILSHALERMIQLSLVKELKKTLSILGFIDGIINSKSYIAAWELIITDSFDKLNIHSGAESIDNCIEILKMLPTCPVIEKLEFSNIINCCLRAKQWHLAATFLPFLNNNKDKESIMQELEQIQKPTEIWNKLMELEVKGLLIVRQVLTILQQTNIFPSIS